KNGDYFAAVSAFGGQATGDYTVRVSDTEVAGDAGTDENLTGDDDGRESRIDFSGDADAYNVSVTAGQRYRIAVTGAARATLSVQPAGGGAAIASGAGPLTITAPEGADSLMVVVSGRGATTGAYNVTVRKL